jgi:signal transduction histidine kinase
LEHAFNLFSGNVLLFLYWTMEEPQSFELINVLIPLLGITFLIALSVLFLYQHFRRNLTIQKLREQELINKQQQELLKSNISVQENVQKRIARDLHDELGATLAISRMHLVKMEQMQGIDEGIKAALVNVRTITETALSSMRRISHELMPAQLDSFGLINTLNSVINQVNQSNQLQVEFFSDRVIRMDWQIEVGLYRMTMELMSNTMKHANASTIEIRLTGSASEITMEYHDNGIGYKFNPERVGLGLKSMQARALALGGTFTIEEKHGFSAKVVIPLTTIDEH